MAFVANNPVLSSELLALKAKVKAEVLRRNQSGSVASYGSSSYDFTSGENPVVGAVVAATAYNKIVDPVRAINSSGIPSSLSTGAIISNLGNTNSRVDVFRVRNLTDRTGTDCASGCTGTCYTGCSTGCYTGCTDACSGCGSGCANSCGGCGGCDGGCWDACSGCGSGCANGCTGSCQGGCGNGCGTACSTNCTSGCGDGCTGNCGGTCFLGDYAGGTCFVTCLGGCFKNAN